MKSRTTSLSTLVERCMLHLEEVVGLSNAVAAAVDADEFDKVEPLFKSRGEKIRILTESEAELERRLNGKPERFMRMELAEYKQKRDRLFNDIQEIDIQVGKSIIDSREAVLSEMKELYRGKKMNESYFNPSTLATAFIDIKE